MRHFGALLLIGALAVFLIGCSSGTIDKDTKESPEVVSAAVPEEAEPSETQGESPASTVPGKKDVLAARERALEGISPEQIERLSEVIIAANLRLESGYLYDDMFGKLEDPDSLYWNYFDQTGEIQIGWAYDGSLDMEAVCQAEGLTEDAFYAKYGTAVSAANNYAADDFITLMEELEASVQNENLKAELHDLAREMELAKGREMEHVNNVYKKLHDLDYFLLRYGPEVFENYISIYDTSTVSKYYGTLSVYNTL